MNKELEKLIKEQALDMDGKLKYYPKRKRMTQKDHEAWLKRKEEKGRI